MPMRQRDHGQQSFADLTLVDLGGPRTAATLARLDAVVPWATLVAPVRALPEYAKYVADPTRPGQRPIDPLVMVKSMMLQKWYGLSDPQAEEQLKDRISFRRFVGLAQDDPTPDETTFVRFRARLREANLDAAIFDAVLAHVARQGLLVKRGTVVDATIVEQARGKKTGETDDRGDDLTTRDREASYTSKHGRAYHGYKLHAAVDQGSAIITDLVTSTAKDHDSQYIDALTEHERRAVFADSAYSDADRRERLEARGVLPGICYKRVRGQAELTPFQKTFNRLVAKLRAAGEHPFAWMRKLMRFTRCRYRGLRRNGFDFTLTAAAYNLKRAASLLAAAAAAARRGPARVAT
jgi:IS5 family transposase